MKTRFAGRFMVVTTAVVACCLGLTAPAAHADGSYNPYLIQGIISPAPLLPVEFNGTGVAAFDVGNTGSTDIPVHLNDEMTLVVTLSKGVPNAADPLAALGGDGVAWFSWSYNPAIRTYNAKQIQTIPGLSRKTITIQYKVAENSFQSAAPILSNGFNVNLQPPGYTHPQPTDDDTVKSYTYVQASDYGDALISYGAAVHTIDVTKNVSTGLYNRYMYLGPAVDPEDVYQASTDAKGDDSNKTGGLNVDDESGVVFPAMTPGETVNIQVKVTLWDWVWNDENPPPAIAYLRGWIDWNNDGAFVTSTTPTERIVDVDVSKMVSGTGPQSFTLQLPVTIPAVPVGQYYARFRLGPALGPTDAAEYGEVEDYRISTDVPTAVLLDNFEAVTQLDHVLVTWETVSEVSNAGFNLYRALAVDGERTLIASEPSKSPGGTAGAAYSSQDFDVQPGQTYWYYLEDLALSGLATLHGPVSVDFRGPVAVTLSALRADAGQGAALWVVVLAGLALMAAPAAFVLRRRVTL